MGMMDITLKKAVMLNYGFHPALAAPAGRSSSAGSQGKRAGSS
jgi:hypothetical protein